MDPREYVQRRALLTPLSLLSLGPSPSHTLAWVFPEPLQLP